MSKNRTGAFFGGLLIGSAVGAVTGLLLAPKSGRDTRQVLQKSVRAMPELAEDLSSNVQVQADRLSENALKNWDGTLNRLRVAIAAGVAAATQARQQQTVAVSDPASSDADSPAGDRAATADRAS